ncbi:MAG: hypothetical protein EXR11_00705 [Rhodospirillaceae bacterium]|nr:hypothetical protein [Rhodospirillaceae bacterium]
MFATYLRIAVIILALIGAVILFAFAFTTAAVVLLVVLLIGFIFGRGSVSRWVVVRRSSSNTQRGPITIDHDPKDLPNRDKTE